jgi:hypothetical protein
LIDPLEARVGRPVIFAYLESKKRNHFKFPLGYVGSNAANRSLIFASIIFARGDRVALPFSYLVPFVHDTEAASS